MNHLETLPNVPLKTGKEGFSSTPSIGHNNPPSAIELAEPVIEALRQHLKDFPVVADEDEARKSKLVLDRCVVALKAIEDERKSKVDPLNVQVKAINAEYHEVHNTDSNRPGLWDRPLNALRARLNIFMREEERKRIAVAEAARRALEEAERLAREAEAREKEAAETAAAGVCDVDIAAATEEADSAFSQFKRASRFAQRAERDTRVRVGGGLGKVSTLRSKEILSVTDWKTAVDEMRDDDGEIPAVIADAILTAARAYRKAFERLPAGISQSFDRSI